MKHLAALAIALFGSGCLHFHNGPRPGEPKDATYLQVEGTRVRYVDVGEGPAVVLLHGFASSIENWVTVMPRLVKDHRVIAIDLRGFGWTDRPVADYSPAAQAKLLKAVLDERKVGKVSIVGHSYGSSVALAFALEYPEQVELHCYAVPDALTDDEVREQLLEDMRKFLPELEDATVRHEHFQLRRDFNASHLGMNEQRPGTDTGVQGLYCAGDWVKLPFPAMLMEGAFSSGVLAANRILAGHGLQEAPVESVPLRGLLAGIPQSPARKRLMGPK